MSSTWFANRGQVIQTVLTALSFVVGLLQALPSLAKYDFASAWPIVVYPAVAWLAIAAFNRFLPPVAHDHARAPPTLPKQEPQPQQEPRSLDLATHPAISAVSAYVKSVKEGFVSRTVVKKFDCALGDFFEVPLRSSTLKVCVTDIRKAALPGNHFGQPRLPDDFAEIDIRLGGGVVIGGPETIYISTNRYLLSAIDNPHQDDEKCVYSISFTEEHVAIFVLRLEHINTHAKQVRMSFCDVYGHAGIT